MEQNPCPCCGERLSVIGSRRRKYITSSGETTVLVIRRLKCRHCNRVHHELPDILVPYKRYGSEPIEPVVGGEVVLTVAADESTLFRWRNWFSHRAEHFAGCLASISIRCFNYSAKDLSALPTSVLQRIWRYVGDAPGWLARVVRPVTNTNHWVHTRSAFLS
ncbi:DUF6431 domain-containing protein [Sporomusa malonica]|uniref:DUF6431 domain-containing protein n=1 Tax=Sporomusa malonica TaxID=112901 RepID=UPI00352AC387